MIEQTLWINEIEIDSVSAPLNGHFHHYISIKVLKAFLQLLSASPSASVCDPHLHNLKETCIWGIKRKFYGCRIWGVYFSYDYPYWRITAITQRNSSECLDMPILVLSWSLIELDGWAGSLIFHGRLVGMVDEICGAFSLRNIFLKIQAASS